MDNFKEWVANHRGMVIGMLVGLVIFILFMTIGAWTLLLLLFIGIGALLGARPDIRAGIGAFFSTLFKPAKQDKD